MGRVKSYYEDQIEYWGDRSARHAERAAFLKTFVSAVALRSDDLGARARSVLSDLDEKYPKPGVPDGMA